MYMAEKKHEVDGQAMELREYLRSVVSNKDFYLPNWQITKEHEDTLTIMFQVEPYIDIYIHGRRMAGFALCHKAVLRIGCEYREFVNVTTESWQTIDKEIEFARNYWNCGPVKLFVYEQD